MNKTILVTGGSGIIGFSIVKYFYEKNYNVVMLIFTHKFQVFFSGTYRLAATTSFTDEGDTAAFTVLVF